MIKQQNTKRKRNQSHNLQFTWTGTSFQCFSKETTTATTDRAPGGFKRSSGAAEPGSMQRWQCHLVPTNNRYHCLESLDCVLCNQLACSIVILQLITWAVNSGQLCLKKKISSNSQAVINSLTTEL